VTRGDRESITDSDPHGLLFGPHDDDSFLDEHEHSGPLPYVRRVSRSERRAERGQRAARRRKGRLLLVLTAGLVALVVVGVVFVVLPIWRHFHPSDYSGNGSGTVIVEVHPNDAASDIGTTLKQDGVVASVTAFTDAAKANTQSRSIQPGSYRLHRHMSAKDALALLLNPASRINSDLVIPEGATSLDVLKRLTAPPCGAQVAPGAICGLGLSQAVVKKALENVQAIGLPTDYTVDGKTPLSVEGFLYPATYPFAHNTSATSALQQMVTGFTDQVRTSNFTAAAKALNISPYEELIIASIAQAEAKFPDDFGKVARVILNRLAATRPLQIDATSAYAAKLAGLDPTKVIYAEQAGPYNTYRHDGLPPTPIDNPGAEAMNGAAHPPAGNWLYYVNEDAAGHLYFTNSEADFERAVAKCRANHWGCG
jgi:UPF0755 protein